MEIIGKPLTNEKVCIGNDRDYLDPEEDETVGACAEYLYLGRKYQNWDPYREGNRKENYKRK